MKFKMLLMGVKGQSVKGASCEKRVELSQGAVCQLAYGIVALEKSQKMGGITGIF